MNRGFSDRETVGLESLRVVLWHLKINFTKTDTDYSHIA